MMTVSHFFCLGAARQGQKLVTQTDAKQGYVSRRNSRMAAMAYLQGSGSPGHLTKDSVRIHCQHILCRRLCRHDGKVATLAGNTAGYCASHQSRKQPPYK